MKLSLHALPTPASVAAPWRKHPLPALTRWVAGGQAAVVALASAVFVLASFQNARAQATATMTILHRFTANGDGANSQAALVQDADGTFYGTTAGGGASGRGTLFTVTPEGAITILHRFSNNADGNPDVGPDGAFPNSGLASGGDGNFYGVTPGGDIDTYGTIYRITPAGDFTLLHRFTGTDGSSLSSALRLARDGNFYGTAAFGETGQYGVVYRVSKAGDLTVVRSFAGGDDGYSPVGKLLEGADGNFYGVTAGRRNFKGGPTGPVAYGSVFRLTPDGAFTTLHTFDGSDGSSPSGGLLQDADGNFYGTVSGGAQYGQGAVFRLTPDGVLTALHSFSGPDGSGPSSGVVRGRDGNFYGTTVGGGSDHSGTVYQITPAGAFTSLYVFAADHSVGASPSAGLVQGADGAFYGSTVTGGNPDAGINDTFGTVFRLDVVPPVPHPAFFDGATALGNGVSFLTFPDGHYFGYYSFLSDPNSLYHFDLGYEYVFDAADGKGGIYLYDFASSTFFYTSTGFPFPYLYDFSLSTVLYYYPDPKTASHYNTDGVRYFYRFDTGATISK